MREKKAFFISVIDNEKSLNRKYSNTIKDLIHSKCSFFEDYLIKRGDENNYENLYENLKQAISGNKYEGYIILLDCLDEKNGMCNPNVMFEFGAIKHLNKPFVIISSHSEPSSFPFDVRDLNIVSIAEFIINKIKECFEKNIPVNISEITQDCIGKEKDELGKFLNKISSNYQESLMIHDKESQDNITNRNIMDEILEVKKIVKSIGITAEYIDGESAAFDAVKEAVEKAQISLHTSRFSNQSIVLSNATKEQKEFMEALYRSSKRLKQKADRIICNNDPLKWRDIYKVLFYGGNGSKVYIRKSDFSIHFELVIIDDTTAFIHFYQPDHAVRSDDDGFDNAVEKINSTLKIRGDSICKKLSNIFNRLHHKDFDLSSPENPSRTLLGIPRKEEINSKDINNGCFFVPEGIPESREFSDDSETEYRKATIIKIFKDAFQTWDWSNDNETEDIDKVYMLVGICLIEKDSQFIEDMKENITDKEYESAKKLYMQKKQDI